MWFIFAIITTFIWGLTEVYYKKGADPYEKYSHLKISVCVGIVMGIHAVFTLILTRVHYNPINILIYFPVSFLYLSSMTFAFFGMRFIEESIVNPVENTSGAICTLLCVTILGKKVSKSEIFAIICIVIGVFGIGIVENIDSDDKRKKFGKVAIIAFLMPFVYAILDAVASFLDVYYLDDVSTTPLLDVTNDTIEIVANTSYEILFFIFALILLLYIKHKKVDFDIKKQKNKIAGAILETTGQFTYVYAMSENGTMAAPVISSVCVVAVVLSRILLKEKLTWKQYVFIGFVILGIITLAIVDK